MTPFKDRFDYIRKTFAAETPAQETARAAMENDIDRIGIYPEEGKLLQILIALSGAERIVEIGTLGGYSALWMADALPVSGEIVTIEKDPVRAAKARNHTAHESRIRIIEGDARHVLSTLTDTYDMVFIDADKLNYAAYLDWAEKYIRAGGLIIGDNTLLFDAVFHDAPVARVRPAARKAMRDFNARLADPARYQSVLLPTAEGMTIARKLF